MKVWFQNRRMKWRHSKLETKLDKSKTSKTEIKDEDETPDQCDSSLDSESCSSDDENEIDIEAE